MYKPVRLDARDRVVRLGAQGKAEQRLGGAERLGGSERRLGGSEQRLGGSERRLGGSGEAAELCGAAEILGVPLTDMDYEVRSPFCIRTVVLQIELKWIYQINA